MKQEEAKLEREKRPSKNWLDQRLKSEALQHQSVVPKPLHNGNGLGNGGIHS